MALLQEPTGPASLLVSNSNWLDAHALFTARDQELAGAALMLWEITRQLRARQGERGLSNSALGVKSGVRRQTIADVLMGQVWPDTKTLFRIASVLGLEITTINQDTSPSQIVPFSQ